MPLRYVRQAVPTPPVTLDEVKAHLRVDFADEDTAIAGMLAAAFEHLDGRDGVVGRCLTPQAWQALGPPPAGDLVLDLSPVTAVSGVRVRRDGAFVALAAGTDYVVRGVGAAALVRPPAGSAWPAMDDDEEAVEVTFTAGFAACPAPLRAAVLLVAGHLYANRESTTAGALRELPGGVAALIAPWRRWSL